jgi:uridine phosphorylase
MPIPPRYYSAVSQHPGPRAHIQCTEEDIGGYVLLPGDPGRVPAIAEHLTGAREIAWSREFRTMTGDLDGTRVSVTSTGIGGPSTAVAIEELVQLGVHTLIRIGTCGAFQPQLRVGDLVIASGAVRDEGTTHTYAPPEFPALSTPAVVSALVSAAALRNTTAHVGVVHTTDTYYGQHEPNRMPITHRLNQRAEAWQRLNVLCSEMETATVLVVGAGVLGCRAGSILAVAGNRVSGEHLQAPGVLERRDRGIAEAIATAVDAVRTLASADRSAT